MLADVNAPTCFMVICAAEACPREVRQALPRLACGKRHRGGRGSTPRRCRSSDSERPPSASRSSAGISASDRSEPTASLIFAATGSHQIRVAGKRTLAVDAIGHQQSLGKCCNGATRSRMSLTAGAPFAHPALACAGSLRRQDERASLHKDDPAAPSGRIGT